MVAELADQHRYNTQVTQTMLPEALLLHGTREYLILVGVQDVVIISLLECLVHEMYNENMEYPWVRTG